jgi:hypothetical protein
MPACSRPISASTSRRSAGLPRLDRGAARSSGGTDEFATLHIFGLRTLGVTHQAVHAPPILAIPRRDPTSLT